MRGMLTFEIQQFAKMMLGREITTTELRLIPYAHYCVINQVDIGYDHKISPAEKEILEQWDEEGRITLYPTYQCRREHYNFMNEILWMAYVKFERSAEMKTMCGLKSKVNH